MQLFGCDLSDSGRNLENKKQVEYLLELPHYTALKKDANKIYDRHTVKEIKRLDHLRHQIYDKKLSERHRISTDTSVSDQLFNLKQIIQQETNPESLG